MSPPAVIGLLTVTGVTAFLLSLSGISVFLPQLIALLSLIFIIINHLRLPSVYLISLIINLIVFATGGLASPLFFAVYFLLFIIALRYAPSISLAYSLVLVLLYSQFLNSALSFIPLVSLLFISPLVYYVSRQVQNETLKDTDSLLWLNLKFKSAIKFIIDESSRSDPDLKAIRQSARNLLNSSQKLSDEITHSSDEI